MLVFSLTIEERGSRLKDKLITSYLLHLGLGGVDVII